MKKNYIVPEILIEEITLDDVIASSGTFGDTTVAGQYDTAFGDLFDIFND